MGNRELKLEKLHYFDINYLNVQRFASYAYQLSEIVSLNPKTILEIGIGPSILPYLLKRMDYRVITVDINISLGPEIVSSVEMLPFKDKSFDVIACFEVLEHLSFDKFYDIISHLREKTRSHIILSLPDVKAYNKIYLPKLGYKLWDRPMQKKKMHQFDGEHYWEINKKNYGLNKVIKIIESAKLSIIKNYRIWEKPYHRFFILKKC